MLNFAIFIAIVGCVYAFMNWFVFTGLVSGLGMNGASRRALKLIFWLFASCFLPGSFFLRYPAAHPVIHVGHIWLGLLSITFSAFVVRAGLARAFPQHARSLTLACLAVSLAASLYAAMNASRPPLVREVKATVKNLPPGLDGFVIVHLSDLHISGMSPSGRLEELAETVNGLDPDLVVITGDVIDFGADGEAVSSTLRRIRAKRGVFAVPGNHEYYAGIGRFMDIMGKSGIAVLRNRASVLNGDLAVIGVDDGEGEPPRDLGEFVGKTLAGAGGGKFAVLLSHRPERFMEAADAGVGLQLSGHTHGGQIPPLSFIVPFAFRYPHGLYGYGDSYIYTTCGTGTWGPPMRLFTRSEMAKIALVRAPG